MSWYLGQLTIPLIIAALIGLAAGWLLWGWGWRKRRISQEHEVTRLRRLADQRDADVASARAFADGEVTRLKGENDRLQTEIRGFAAAPKVAAAPASADKLEVIEGIGPQIATALKASGINTFCELAGADEARLRSALEKAKLSFAPSLPTWARQGDHLCKSDYVGFVRLTDQLTAGRGAAAGKDDLKRIEGIGPKMEEALHAAGILTFQALSTTGEPQLRAAIETAGLPFAPSLGTWAEQAGLLARGDEAGFKALTDRLTAGRKD